MGTITIVASLASAGALAQAQGPSFSKTRTSDTAVASLSNDLRGRSSPYYNDSPLFAPQTTPVWPMMRLQPQGAPVPTSVPAQSTVTPWAPSPAVPQATLAPAAAATVVPPPTQPASPVKVPLTPPAAPQPAAAPASPPAGAADAPTAVASTAAPFVDQTVFLPARQEWREYDITAYTAKFPPSARAEDAVRQWILRETGEGSWHGIDVASLTVSPSRIRVYHGPQTQEQVARLLGRFLYYVPGQFRSRVRIWSVKDSDWRSRSAVALQSVGKGPAAGKVWLISPADANVLAEHLSHRNNGTVLAEPEFLVANGQTAQVRWSEDNTSGSAATDGASVDEGITLRFSPLIAEDAVSLTVDIDAVARRRQEKGVKRIGHYGPTPAIVPVDAAETKTQVQLPPGRVVLLSLGLFPELPEQKRLLGKVKKQELVALIEIVPEGVNTIAGTPIVAPQAAVQPADRKTVAKPSRGWQSPPELTRPVF